MKQMLKLLGTITATVMLLTATGRAGNLTVNGNLTVTTNEIVNGNVGIGTANPGAKLELSGTGLGTQQRITDTASGNSLVLQAGSASNMKVTGYKYATGTAIPLYLSVDGANTILNANGGNVGINISTPGSTLDVNGNVTFRGGAGFYSPGNYDMRLTTEGTFPNYAFKIYDTTTGFRYDRFAITSGGNVGIGTTSPDAPLYVNGGLVNGGNILPAALHVINPYGYGQPGIFVEQPGAGDFARIRMNVTGRPYWVMEVNDSATPSLIFSYDSIGTLASIGSDGTMQVKVLQINGADVAEPFAISTKDIPKGSVVIIDEANPGQLRASERAYDKHVAGILSGANGVNSGILLKQKGFNDEGQNVALSGRVYALADASTGPIKPGDLLTTSDTPGHCMKVTNHGKAQGAIIGKAMSTLESGRGMVLVLVSLQ
jgi:hypothetical protein